MSFDQRESKRRLVLRLKGVESGRPLIGPATVQIHVTDRCNLACQYCYYHGPESTHRSRGNNHLPFDMFVKVVRDCVDLKVDEIYLSGRGDPTLHPRFYEILEHLQHKPLSVTIYSNGTFPTKRCREILKADRIVINLGAADRTLYRTLQGKDFFMKVIKNIRELARLRHQLNPNFRMEIVFIATRLNVASQSKLENLVKRLGVGLVRKTASETSEHNQHIKLSDREKKTVIGSEWRPCYYGWFYSAIKLNGDVSVCCFMQRLTIGNIYKTSFKNIWGSKAYARARASALTGYPFKNYQECMNCRVAWRNNKIATQMQMYHNRSRKI